MIGKSKIPGNDPLPHDLELERTVLSAMMQNNKAAEIVGEVLENVHNPFYLEQHNMIYGWINTLVGQGLQADIVALATAARDHDALEFIGGTFYLTKILDACISPSNIRFYAQSLYELWLRRAMIEKAWNVTQASFDNFTDPFETLGKFVDNADGLVNAKAVKTDITPETVAHETYSYIKAVKNHEIETLASYYNGFNVLTGGYQDADYVIIAARPSIGKTAYTLSELRYMSYERDIPTAFISLDSKRRNIMFRLYSMETGINVKNLRMGYLYDHQLDLLAMARDKHASKKLLIDDSALRTNDIRNRLKTLKIKHDIQVAVIDFVQIVDTNQRKNQSREREIAEVSSELKKMAKDLNLVVIGLSQLNRGVEARTDKRPMLSDLRDSGGLEQDADIVVMLHRPEYYGYEFFDKDHRENAIGKAEVIIAKGRDVGTGNFKIDFLKQNAHFLNPADQDETNFAPETPVEEDLEW